MTYGPRNLVGIYQVHKGKKPTKGLLFSCEGWPKWAVKVGSDFLVAVVCYIYLFPLTFPEAKEWQVGWVSKVVLFNLACEVIFYGFWHHITYVSSFATGPFKKMKYNAKNQYEETGRVGYIFSSSGQLQREVFLTTLGWLQSSAFQCVMMWLWASGRLPYYADFWSRPYTSIGGLLFVTYWREFHFYWVHRAMHPWWSAKYGLLQGDIGSFLYRNFHSLHHKSYNPGPWSGLSMHPVEHFFYYTCSLLSLFYTAHPLHFLYAKFHADIAPIGGHDGYADPGGNADFHWLHHTKFECNFGVPLIDFDRLFGTWRDYEVWKSTNEKVTGIQPDSIASIKGSPASSSEKQLKPPKKSSS